jgi:hypothetical protein
MSIKSVETLCREAAGVIPLGGGFQIYNTQNRDGSVRLWEVRELKDISKFVRDREPFVKGSNPFSDIGILYSDYDMKNKVDSLFYPGGSDGTRGAIRIMLDSAHTCSILMDYMITAKYLKEKNIIILPELKYMNDEIKKALLEFAEDGGNIIISGHECCKLFDDVLTGITLSDECKNEAIFIYDNPRYISQYARVSSVVSESGEIIRKCSNSASGIDEKPIITKTKYGKGNIIAVHYNIFETYCNTPNFYIRNMMSEIVDDLTEDKFIEYRGQKFADIVTAKKDNKLLINLTNTSGIYGEIRLRAYDEVQTLTNIEITVKTEKEPESVVLQPENIVPHYKYNSQTQKLTVTIDRLHIHSVIVIE